MRSLPFVVIIGLLFTLGCEKDNPRDTSGNDIDDVPEKIMLSHSYINEAGDKYELNFFGFERYMVLLRQGTSFQDNTIYGDLLFQSHHSNDVVDVYNLSTRKFEYSIESSPEETMHNNTVDFGPYKFDDDDEFPILYMSGRGVTHHTNAFRIVDTDHGKELKKIQKINFRGERWTTTSIDRESHIMCVCHEEARDTLYSMIRIPDYSDNELEYSINEGTRIDSIRISLKQIGQGRAINKGIMYHLSGMAGDGRLNIINLATHETYCNIPLERMGITAEPEGLCFWDDNIMITDSDGNVFKGRVEINKLGNS